MMKDLEKTHSDLKHLQEIKDKLQLELKVSITVKLSLRGLVSTLFMYLHVHVYTCNAKFVQCTRY